MLTMDRTVGSPSVVTRLFPRLPREITPESVAEWVYGIVGDDCPLTQAITAFSEQMILADRAIELVRQYGNYIVQALLDRSEQRGRPADQFRNGRTFDGPLRPSSPSSIIDHADGEGQPENEAHDVPATPSASEPLVRELIPQTFPDPTVDQRRVSLGPLKPPPSMLECKWSISRNNLVTLGDCRAADLLILERREAKIGKTRLRMSVMFRRLRTSLTEEKPRVRDQWTDAGLMAQFELAEPVLVDPMLAPMFALPVGSESEA